MKKRSISSIVSIFLCFSVLFTSLSVGTPVSAQAQDETRISFSEVGATNLVLSGPYDSQSLSFSLPDNWQLLEGTTIVLYVEVFITTAEGNEGRVDDFAGASLNVYFNRRLQSAISLVVGEERIYRVPIRLEDLSEEASDGRVQISFFLDAGIDCDYGFHKTTVKISPESTLNVVHSEKTPSLDLRNLPRPIYKKSSYLPEIAKVVVPDEASADELRAAYLTVSAFARMTGRDLDLEMITSKQLTQTMREEAHLIFVGKATSFPLLFQQQMSVPILAGKYSSPVLQPDDGLLQMFISPWNPSKVILVVGGNSDVGVVKASQALTTGNIQTSALPAVSFVAQVAPLQVQTEQGDSEFISSLEYTLADLGYSVQQAGIGASGMGTQWFSYEFSIPIGQVAEEQTYFDLVYSNSSLVDPARSEISVFVNGFLSGSVQFDEDSAGFVKKRIEIPPALILPGRNKIDFAAELIPFDMCTTLNLNGLWMSIYADSLIHVQLTEIAPEQLQLLELRNYPYPYLAEPTMSDLTVVLPRNDKAGWLSLGNLIYDLGGRATGEVISFDVSFSGELSEEDFRNNWILYGVPEDLALENELNAALPAPFEPGSNVAVLDNQTVVYRIEANKSLGYLELLPSPWDETRTILAVLGTNNQGLEFSIQALVNSKIRNGLKGNFAAIDGEQFVVVDTRSGLGLGSFPVALGPEIVEEVEATPTVSNDQADAPAYDSTRQAILIMLGIVLAAIIVVAVTVFVLRKRKRSRS